MILKIIIVGLLIGLAISLGSGLVFLFKDIGTTRRTLHSLGVRIALALTLMATILYGFFTGQLEIGAPWDARKWDAQTTESLPESAEPAVKADPAKSLEDIDKDK